MDDLISKAPSLITVMHDEIFFFYHHYNKLFQVLTKDGIDKIKRH